MQDMLYLSPSGGSGQGILAALGCRHKIHLRRQGWRLRRTPTALWYGGRIHGHAFRPYTHPEDCANLPGRARADIERIVREGTYEYLWTPPGTHKPITICEQAEIPENEKLDLPSIADFQMQVWALGFPAPDIVQACEQRVVVEPVDPQAGRVTQEATDLHFRFIFRPDIALGQSTVRAIRDLKTIKAVPKNVAQESFAYYFSLSAYRYGLVVAQGFEDFRDLAILPLTKHKMRETIQKYFAPIPVVNPMPFRRVYEMMLAAAKRVRECEASGQWPQEPVFCQGEWSMCEFYPLCFPEAWPSQEVLDAHVAEKLELKGREGAF